MTSDRKREILTMVAGSTTGGRNGCCWFGPDDGVPIVEFLELASSGDLMVMGRAIGKGTLVGITTQGSAFLS